jgi:hypothetical protein
MRFVTAAIRAPMGATQSGGLIVAAGPVLLIIDAVMPKPDDALWKWAVWWLVLATAIFLLLRGVVGILAWLVSRGWFSWSWLRRVRFVVLPANAESRATPPMQTTGASIELPMGSDQQQVMPGAGFVVRIDGSMSWIEPWAYRLGAARLLRKLYLVTHRHEIASLDTEAIARVQAPKDWADSIYREIGLPREPSYDPEHVLARKEQHQRENEAQAARQQEATVGAGPDGPIDSGPTASQLRKPVPKVLPAPPRAPILSVPVGMEWPRPPKAQGLPAEVWEKHQGPDFCALIAGLIRSGEALLSGLQALPVTITPNALYGWSEKVKGFNVQFDQFWPAYWKHAPTLSDKTFAALPPAKRESDVQQVAQRVEWLRTERDRICFPGDTA